MMPMTTSVSATPIDVGDRKCAISLTASGEAIIAPPPNPMIASPVAMPGRSGNHLMSVETGEMYPIPRPIPPSTPYPNATSQNSCSRMPSALTKNPPLKHTAEVNIALRGPTRSIHRPNTAADSPRNTIATWNRWAMVPCFQSPAAGALIPTSVVIGILKTLNAYAWPMER